jgi:hypothetical protein
MKVPIASMENNNLENATPLDIFFVIELLPLDQPTFLNSNL